MTRINDFIGNDNSKIMKLPALSTIKTCNCCQKTNCPMDSSALFPKHLLTPLLKNITMVLLKTLSKNITIRKNVLLEIHLVKRTKDYLSMYGNRKRRIVEKCQSLTQKNTGKCDLCICQKLLIEKPIIILRHKHDEHISKCRQINFLKCFQHR